VSTCLQHYISVPIIVTQHSIWHSIKEVEVAGQSPDVVVQDIIAISHQVPHFILDTTRDSRVRVVSALFHARLKTESLYL
jgi:hypothetical protein